MNTQNQLPTSKDFVSMALIPAFAISIPYAYLLWHEAVHYDYPFWGSDLLVLLGAPFIAYGLIASLLFFLRERVGNRRSIYWAGVSVLGSFTALAVWIAYFYGLGNPQVPWRDALSRIFLLGAGLSGYTSVFMGLYFYAQSRLNKSGGTVLGLDKF